MAGTIDPFRGAWPRRRSRNASYGMTGAKVVVIDNDPVVLDAMQALLERWTCDVAPAAAISARSIALIADGHSAPTSSSPTTTSIAGACGVDGRRAAARLRSAIPICRPSSSPRTAHRQSPTRCARRDCELLLKPVKPAELRALMMHCLARPLRLPRSVTER